VSKTPYKKGLRGVYIEAEGGGGRFGAGNRDFPWVGAHPPPESGILGILGDFGDFGDFGGFPGFWPDEDNLGEERQDGPHDFCPAKIRSKTSCPAAKKRA